MARNVKWHLTLCKHSETLAPFFLSYHLEMIRKCKNLTGTLPWKYWGLQVRTIWLHVIYFMRCRISQYLNLSCVSFLSDKKMATKFSSQCNIITELPNVMHNIIWAMTWQNQQNEYVPSEDSDQPGHPPSLIRVSLCSQWVAKDQSFLHADSKYSDQTGRMPGLICLRWAHSSFVGFVIYWLRNTMLMNIH